MARNGIQYSDVQQAIDTLLSRGDTPSVQRIRDVLGTGSFTTISEHFRLWRTEREQNRDVPPPKGVPEVVVNLASELWREAQEVANQALVHYREEANRQVEEAQQAAAEALQQAVHAEQRESALAEHLRHTEQRLEALTRELATSQTSEQHLHQTAEDLRGENQQLKLTLEALRQQNADNAQQYNEELKAQQTGWEKRLAQEEQRNEAAEGRLMAMLDDARQERAQEEKAAQKRAQQKQQRIDTLSEELKSSRQEVHRHQLETGQALQRIKELEQHSEALKQQQDVLTEQLEKAQIAQRQQAEQTRQAQDWQTQMVQHMASLQQQLAELPASISVREQQSNKK
ncbi:DNA-binding protein [Halomonas aquamarina]|uniref:DNA-binding protein n=1 Tax=Vreelandella aquamarina TaxID=77097 RepID=A0ACC5VUX6_9GAMM|nr:DNA-binding protein [Halomonas aquamarina]MBZ5487862.1 DNA-binding protein [Halomonas aquamarina]